MENIKQSDLLHIEELEQKCAPTVPSMGTCTIVWEDTMGIHAWLKGFVDVRIR